MTAKERTVKGWMWAALTIAAIAGISGWYWFDQRPKLMHYRLLAAAASGDAQAAADLIRRGAPVNAKFGGDGDTALHRAAAYGHADIAKLLLQAGADVNVGDAEGATPLLAAAYHGRREVVKILLEAGANVNTQEVRHGFTALQEAVRKGHIDVVRLLLANGADVNARSKDGRTALTRAQAQGNVKIETELKHAGAQE